MLFDKTYMVARFLLVALLKAFQPGTLNVEPLNPWLRYHISIDK